MAPAGGGAHVAGDRRELVEGDAGRAEGADVLGQPVLRPLGLALERPEQPVPDDQDPAVVAVEVDLVRAVVDAVVRGVLKTNSSGAGSRPIRSVWIQNW